jgi:putative acetyltransferase
VLQIRSEAPDDAAAIRAVHLAAFDTAGEADLVEAVRATTSARSRDAVVASADGRIVGHALLSHVELLERGVARPAMLLAPVAVTPAFQHRGVGTALVHECIGRAEHAFEPILLLVGHPAYYPRFGFVPAARLGIEPPEPQPGEVLLVRRLARFDPAWRGRVRYPDAFALVMRDLQRPPLPRQRTHGAGGMSGRA